MADSRSVTVEEIGKHATADDCWLVIDSTVWDLTEFAPNHPGGAAIITKHAGRDATKTYNEIHASSILATNLDPSKRIGTLDLSTVNDEWLKPPPEKTSELAIGEKPALETILNTYDFEEIASRTLSKKTWAFYSSAATDCISRDANKAMFDRIWWRPRLLRNVKEINTKTTILGCETSIPLFISPAALAKLVHPEGEKAMARACEAKGIIQFLSTNASFPIAEIVNETSESQPVFFQLYVNSDHEKTKALLAQMLDLRPRIRGICITIDAPVIGKREADERVKADETLIAPNSGASAKNDKKGGGLGRIMGAYIDSTLNWEDLKWIREAVGPDMPLVVKGVQTAADAKLAMQAGLNGIVLSNHGGRSLDTSPPAVITLLEMHRSCPEVFDKLDVLVDGGIRRGTDIIKCLCLGAKAVGIGRHFLYALNYGQEGVEHLIELMKDELEVTMRMIGLTDVHEAHPGYINTGDVDHLVPLSMEEHPYAKWKPKARI